MRGKILDFNEETNSGIISAQDNKRYKFILSDIKSKTYGEFTGLDIDFVPDGEEAKEIYTLNTIQSIPFYEDQITGFASLFSAKGCYTRAQYWKVSLLVLVPYILFFMLVAFTGMLDDQNESSDELVSVFIFLFFGIFFPTLYISVVTSIKRFHDTNRSGLYYFLSFIPYLGGLILLIMNGFLKTVKEGNKYCRRKKS